MPQVFHPSTNTIAKASIFGAVFIFAAAVWVMGALVRSPYVTESGVVREQPVPFSHQHHVADDGIDCRYCHTSVEDSAFAGMPSTETCMGCHSVIWADSAMLEPVRASFRTGEPIAWTRVHDVPDFVYFDHSIHLSKGIGCVTCHGRVDRMPLMWREATLLMEWCLECHRNPAPHVRPKEELFSMDWERPDDEREASALEEVLMKQYGVQRKTNCSICHR